MNTTQATQTTAAKMSTRPEEPVAKRRPHGPPDEDWPLPFPVDEQAHAEPMDWLPVSTPPPRYLPPPVRPQPLRARFRACSPLPRRPRPPSTPAERPASPSATRCPSPPARADIDVVQDVLELMRSDGRRLSPEGQPRGPASSPG